MQKENIELSLKELHNAFSTLMNITITESGMTLEECIDKQIPKKPLYGNYDDNGFDEIIPYKAVCPSCSYEFEFGTYNDEENHHCVCGQKMDWT